MLVVFSLVIPLLTVVVEGSLTPPVDTTHGPVIGELHTYDGTTVHVFKGIPYAAPPTGHLRFAPPEAPEPWTEPLQTTGYGNRCVAVRSHDFLFYSPPRVAPPMSEDCLYLNVVVPKTGKDKKLVDLGSF